VADDELGDRAFQSLSGRIGNLVIVELQRAEMSELLSDCCVESAWRHFLLWHRIQLPRVTATQIACACGHRENDERKNEQSTHHRRVLYVQGKSRQTGGASLWVRSMTGDALRYGRDSAVMDRRYVTTPDPHLSV